MRQSLWRPMGWPCCGAWAGNLERASATPSISEFWCSKGIADRPPRTIQAWDEQTTTLTSSRVFYYCFWLVFAFWNFETGSHLWQDCHSWHQFPHLKNKHNNSIVFLGLLRVEWKLHIKHSQSALAPNKHRLAICCYHMDLKSLCISEHSFHKPLAARCDPNWHRAFYNPFFLFGVNIWFPLWRNWCVWLHCRYYVMDGVCSVLLGWTKWNCLLHRSKTALTWDGNIYSWIYW